MTEFLNFTGVFNAARKAFKHNSRIVHSETWQGIDISKRPEAAMHEVQYFNCSVPLPTEDLLFYRNSIKPNLPWADDHFLERVCGEPLNPGKEWANWPYGHSADRFRDDNGQFNHNYMERYWPRLAGMTDQGILTNTKFDRNYYLDPDSEQWGWEVKHSERWGIRYRYGDLNDLLLFMQQQPHSRRAYFPIFFPEDTGVANPDRAPCTLGYLFMMREDRIDVTYYIRSCDYIRHFRDDIYLTIRLLLWVLDRLREKDPRWKRVTPRLFRMDIGSLHMFRNDYIQLFSKEPGGRHENK